MAYSFEQIFAADPSNPANIAQNAAITIYAPGDATETPIALTDPSGSPLTNPVPVNANGFGSAFMADIDRVAWKGGGFSGFFTSYEGMKEVAVAAQTAAEDAAAAAGAEATAVATAAIAGATDEATAAAASAATAASNASASATAAANAAALVGAPADSAIAAAVNNGASATKAALNATYATTSAVTGKLDKTEAVTTYTRKRGARVALLGDSITAGNYPTAGTTNATGYFVWANILLNSRMSPVFDADGLAFGYAGITANTLLNGGECAQAAASNADIVVEFSGTNDLTNGEANNTPAGIAASRLAMWQMLIAAGKQVVACTILPRRDNTALNASIRTANRLIRKNAMATPGVVLCDWHAALVDPTDGYSSTLYLRSDNLHVNAVGASRMGKLLADVLDKLIPTFGDSDLPTANGEGLINNSLMTGTGGTYFGNATGFGTATGAVAAGWTLGNSGAEGGSITGAKVARTDLWPGEWQQVTLATPPNPTADRMWLRGTSTALGGAAVGDLVYAAVEFQTDAAGWDIRHIAVNVDFPGTAVLGKALDIASAYLTAQTVPISRPASGVIKTLPVAIPAGATAVRVAINMYGSGTLRFGRTGVFKVV